MRRGLLACALVLAVPLGAQAATGSGGWWQTPDQQGAALLRKGDAEGAAQHFRDPRWRAYAQIKAGDYQAAAQGLAAFDDADAHYNRGNALARTGDLQGALAAFDAALAKDPQDMDARHNRDLVAKALQNRQSPTGSGGKSGEGTPKQGEQSGQAKRDGKAGERKPEDGKQSTQQGRGEREHREGSAATNSGTKQQDGPGRQRTATSNDQSRESGGAQAQQDAESSKNGDDQAKSDAQAAARRAGTAPPPQPAQAAGAATADLPPRTESQLALDQWLRRLPDDPAGLLRRKFMIEHLMRQQEAQQ